MDIWVTDSDREKLFSRGFVVLSLSQKQIQEQARQQQKDISDFLEDRISGKLCVELERTAELNQADNDLIQQWVANHELRFVTQESERIPTDYYEICGKYSELLCLQQMILQKKLQLRQIWCFIERTHEKKSDPLTEFLVQIFEQLYGKLETEERSVLLSRPRGRLQLYSEGSFIAEHQDAYREETMPSGEIYSKKCVILCYLNDDWTEKNQGVFECILDVPRENANIDLSPTTLRGDNPHIWENNERERANPILGTVVVLDFSQFNNPHLVHPVQGNGFVRKMFGCSIVTKKYHK